jgi:hypothetical protein
MDHFFMVAAGAVRWSWLSKVILPYFVRKSSFSHYTLRFCKERRTRRARLGSDHSRLWRARELGNISNLAEVGLRLGYK